MKQWPEIPSLIGEHGMEDQELSELWTELIAELTNPRYMGRTHHNRRTYDAGCTGPLCRKASRERSRAREKARVSQKYYFVDRILDFWRPVAEIKIAEAHNRIIKDLTS